MIHGVGTDIILISRIEAILAEKNARESFVSCTYSERELETIQASDHASVRFATHFAAKEAVFKSLGISSATRFLWRDIEIAYTENGVPYAVLHGKIKEYSQGEIHLSLSFDGDVAQAFAVCEMKKEN